MSVVSNEESDASCSPGARQETACPEFCIQYLCLSIYYASQTMGEVEPWILQLQPYANGVFHYHSTSLLKLKILEIKLIFLFPISSV